MGEEGGIKPSGLASGLRCKQEQGILGRRLENKKLGIWTQVWVSRHQEGDRGLGTRRSSGTAGRTCKALPLQSSENHLSQAGVPGWVESERPALQPEGSLEGSLPSLT